MSTRRSGTLVLCAAWLIAACAGCAVFGEPPVPPAYLTSARSGGPGADGYGAWVIVQAGFGGDARLEGELIVCRNDSLWVLTDRGLRSGALRSVRWLRIYKEVGMHGPIREESMSEASEAALRPWARFPQGRLPGLDPSSLHLKPAPRP